MLHNKAVDLTSDANNAPIIETLRADERLTGWSRLLVGAAAAAVSWLLLIGVVMALFALVGFLRATPFVR